MDFAYGQIPKLCVRSWAPTSTSTVYVHCIFAPGGWLGLPWGKYTVYIDGTGGFGGSAPDTEFHNLAIFDLDSGFGSFRAGSGDEFLR